MESFLSDALLVTSMRGTIVFVHTKKLYGFIETDELENDVFIWLGAFLTEDECNEINDLDGDELEGAEVEFEYAEGDRGNEVTEITVLDEVPVFETGKTYADDK